MSDRKPFNIFVALGVTLIGLCTSLAGTFFNNLTELHGIEIFAICFVCPAYAVYIFTYAFSHRKYYFAYSEANLRGNHVVKGNAYFSLIIATVLLFLPLSLIWL